MQWRTYLTVWFFLAFSGDILSQTIRVPRSIDGSGKKDVSNQLNSFFNSVPDNSTVVFPKEKVYRVEGILRIRNKKDLVIRGNGSTIIAETTGKDFPVPDGKPRYNWPRSREHLSIENSRRITISGLMIKGPHIGAGLGDHAYVKELEAQHGVNVYGSSQVTLDSLRITNVYGDCVYIGDGAAKVSSDSIVIQRSFFGHTGRQGIAITHGTHIIVQDCEFSEVRRTHIDLEGNNTRSVIKDIFIKSNTFRSSRLNWISAAGKGLTADVYVINNKLVDKEANVTLGNLKSRSSGPFYFINNSSTRPMGNPHGAAWRVVNVNGFFAAGNKIAVKQNRNMYLVGQSNSSNIVLKDNLSAHLTGPLKDL